MGLTFHHLIKQDLKSVLTHYEEEVGLGLAGRFYREFEDLCMGNDQRQEAKSGVNASLVSTSLGGSQPC